MIRNPMSAKDPIRPQIRALDLSGITKVAMLGLGNPGILPLWFGESDLVTPKFIRDAATAALEDGKTFYTFARGIPQLRQAVAAFVQRTVGPEIDVARVTVPGAAMLGVTSALQCVAEAGDNVVVISPIWPNNLSRLSWQSPSPLPSPPMGEGKSAQRYRPHRRG